MSTTAPPQMDADSFDTAGVSTATSIPSSSNARLGSIYDPVSLAAAAPIWFHPTHDGSYIMVAARRWSAASPVGGTPGLFSAYTETLAPTWLMVNSGQRRPIPGQPIDIPTNTSTDSPPTPIAGASKAPDYLFLLHSAVIGGVSSAILQRFAVSYTGAVSLAAEEVLPTVTVDDEVIVFNKGMQIQDPYLHLYGTDSTGAIYRMRKSWHAVGANKLRYDSSPKQEAGLELYWQYFMGTGFSADPTEASPMPGMTTAGPMSFGSFLNAVVMTTVAKSGTVYTGVVWLSKRGQEFKRVGSSVALGDSSTGTYLGGGIQLQPGLPANPLDVAMTPGTQAGIPYLVSTKVISGSNRSLAVNWNIFPVSL